MKKKIAIIGCGNLGSAILKGLLQSKTVSPQNIIVTKQNPSSLKGIPKEITVTNNNLEAVKNSDILLFALKPYTILEVIEQLQPVLNAKKHTIVSMATGISIQQIQQAANKEQLTIFRAMPNTAADVNASLTCICSNTTIDDDRELIDELFSSIGKTIFITEELMQAATVLGACGIAFALRFIRGMIQGGIQIGFDSTTATTIATQTVLGATELLQQRNNHPEHEIDKVTTPRGCTITGLNEMEHNGFSSALIKGILASYQDIQQ